MPKVKLTKTQIAEIKLKYGTEGVTCRSLAAEYGVAPSVIAYHGAYEKSQNTLKRYKTENPDLIRETTKRYRDNHPEKLAELGRIWQSKNRDKLTIYQVKYHKKRLASDPCYKLAYKLRNRTRQALKKGAKTGSAVADLGCSIPELRGHLEAKFQPGMNWDNYGRGGWHIDHIVPLASFDLTDREQFLKASHYTNLQPLWELDNIRKRDTMPAETNR